MAITVLAACAESSAPRRPTSLALGAPAPASVTVGSAVPGVAVIVKDDKGNVMAGQPLTISVSGGSLAGAPVQTQAGGPTSIGTWTVASKSGPNILTVASGTLSPISVTVQGTAGSPAKVAPSPALPASAVVGNSLPVGILVTDQYENPVGGATVRFAVTGGGSLAAPTAIANAEGIASAPTWTLGTKRGLNGLTATAGTATVAISIVAQPDVPATIQISAGGGQTAPAGSALGARPGVMVLDRFANGVPSQMVSFAVGAGGGNLSGDATATSDSSGAATGPSWVLGKRNVPQQLIVTSGSARGLFTAAVRTSMSIDLRFVGAGMTSAQKAVFMGAAQRLSAMITAGAGPVNAVNFDLAANCGLTGMAPLNETIDGIVIYASIDSIDGPGKILAQAGPCATRGSSGSYQPAIGIILFDSADVARLARGGSLEDVATHEMMHTLGFGTIWSALGLTSGLSTADPRYLGAGGTAGCRTVGGTVTCAGTVPLENTGGEGTFGSHWRESVFTNELMTGYINAGANPLSLMSIASMTDFRYTVNTAATDAYSLAAALRAQAPQSSMSGDWERVMRMTRLEQLEATGSGLMQLRRSR